LDKEREREGERVGVPVLLAVRLLLAV
jgi:hypothetical protein